MGRLRARIGRGLRWPVQVDLADAEQCNVEIARQEPQRPPVKLYVIGRQPCTSRIGDNHLFYRRIETETDIEAFERDRLALGRGQRTDNPGHQIAAGRDLQRADDKQGHGDRDGDQESEDPQGQIYKTHLR